MKISRFDHILRTMSDSEVFEILKIPNIFRSNEDSSDSDSSDSSKSSWSLSQPSIQVTNSEISIIPSDVSVDIGSVDLL